MLSRSECTDKSGVADGNCAAGFGLTNLYSSNIRLIGFNKSLFLFPADEKCRFSTGVVTILNPESGLAFVVLLQPPPAQLLWQPTSPMFRLVKSIFLSEKEMHNFIIANPQNTNYPSGYLPTAASTCTFTVNKINADICQLRSTFSYLSCFLLAFHL